MRFAILILSILSAEVMACPNLAGSYLKCVSAMTGGTLGMSKVNVSQKLKNNVTVYTINFKQEADDGTENDLTDVYVTDSKPVVTEVDGDYKIYTTSSCVGDSLKITEELMLGDAPLSYAEGEISKFENKLQMDYMEIDENGENVSHSIVCQ